MLVAQLTATATAMPIAQLTATATAMPIAQLTATATAMPIAQLFIAPIMIKASRLDGAAYLADLMSPQRCATTIARRMVRRAARTTRDIATGRTVAKSPHTGGVVNVENGRVTWRRLSEAESLDRLMEAICGPGRWARRS